MVDQFPSDGKSGDRPARDDEKALCFGLDFSDDLCRTRPLLDRPGPNWRALQRRDMRLPPELPRESVESIVVALAEHPMLVVPVLCKLLRGPIWEWIQQAIRQHEEKHDARKPRR